MPKSPHVNKRIASVPMSRDMKRDLEKIAKELGVDFGTVVRMALEKTYGIKGDWKDGPQKTDGKS